MVRNIYSTDPQCYMHDHISKNLRNYYIFIDIINNKI